MSLLAQDLTKCTVCSIPFDESEGADLAGYFGMIPVAFCATCTSCMIDMTQQLTSQDEEYTI